MLICGEAAEQVAGGEEQIADDEAVASSEKIGESSRDRLAGRVRDELCRGEPGN
jgi:hypothetical protein